MNKRIPIACRRALTVGTAVFGAALTFSHGARRQTRRQLDQEAAEQGWFIYFRVYG